jgi:hypothetical protein
LEWPETVIGMNEAIPDIRAPDLPEALPDDLEQVLRKIADLREANAQAAAELARLQVESAELEARQQ